MAVLGILRRLVDRTLVSENFDYFLGTKLTGGTSNGGTGWTSGWEAISGGGLDIVNNRID